MKHEKMTGRGTDGLEKGDLPAMLLSAFGVIWLPVFVLLLILALLVIWF